MNTTVKISTYGVSLKGWWDFCSEMETAFPGQDMKVTCSAASLEKALEFSGITDPATASEIEASAQVFPFDMDGDGEPDTTVQVYTESFDTYLTACQA